MPLLLSFIGILCLILLIVWCKLDTFISFIIVSVGLGLACGMDVHQISSAIQKGIGNILGSLVIILGFGAMLGKLVAESGAAQQITQSLIRLSGIRNIQWAMAFAGLLVGIPMFYTAGFVVVVPLIFAIGASTGLPLLYIGMPMLAALSVAHGFLPPHPSPTAIAQQLHADIGKTLLYGMVAGIPSIILAGVFFGKTLRKYKPVPDPSLLTVKIMEQDQLPGLGLSLLTALMPLVLLTATTLSQTLSPARGTFSKIIGFVGEPNMAMLISVLVAIYALGLKRGRPMKQVMKSMEDAFKGVAPVMLVIAGSGVFMQVMSDGGVNVYIAESLKNTPISPLVLGWGISAIIRVCTGSATVAGLTTVGILLPLLHQPAVQPELMVLAIGAGSLMFSHVNDGGFWLFKEYFNLTIRQTFATWTIMETIVSVSGLLIVLLLNQIVH
jgi:Gnt-I system high-affinity gluconate transporter